MNDPQPSITAASTGTEQATPLTWVGLPLPYPATVTAVIVAIITIAVVAAARYCDPTRGQLTISVMLVLAFVATTFASILYAVPQIPSTEILVGALATAVGAVVAYWLGRGRGSDDGKS